MVYNIRHELINNDIYMLCEFQAVQCAWHFIIVYMMHPKAWFLPIYTQFTHYSSSSITQNVNNQERNENLPRSLTKYEIPLSMRFCLSPLPLANHWLSFVFSLLRHWYNWNHLGVYRVDKVEKRVHVSHYYKVLWHVSSRCAYITTCVLQDVSSLQKYTCLMTIVLWHVNYAM